MLPRGVQRSWLPQVSCSPSNCLAKLVQNLGGDAPQQSRVFGLGFLLLLLLLLLAAEGIVVTLPALVIMSRNVVLLFWWHENLLLENDGSKSLTAKALR